MIGSKLDKEEIAFYILVLLGFLIMLAVLVMIFAGPQIKCSRLQKAMPDREFRWLGFLEGCCIKTDSGLWIDVKNLHMIEIDENNADG